MSMLFGVVSSLKRLQTLDKQLDGVEIRLDLLDKIDLQEIKEALNNFSLPVLFTLRKSSQGGRFAKSESQRLHLIEKLILLEPSYFDLESDTHPSFIEKMAACYPKTKI